MNDDREEVQFKYRAPDLAVGGIELTEFGTDQSGWTVAGALEGVIFGVPCSAER